ncbi:MAG: FAD-linked oxidase C-terminal domain-containing protein [Bacteroidia bacterium]|nr:FAD-binding protein [Bacteroidia bacterium]MDW8158923.1 FAD-linked oxidase C-terminal domain-containing protein [Bacteroidia bacterium]
MQISELNFSKTFNYKKITIEDIAYFEQVVGKENVFCDSFTIAEYAHDWTEDFYFPAEVILKPKSTCAISQILSYCNHHIIPVTPIGGRTGLSGGMLPLFGGVGLSLEKMNRILEIDTQNLQATVEPGVITQVLQEAVLEHGLMYPPDPSSRGSCFIGGNVAENAGGIHAVKYGITREYILGLEAVLPSGEIIQTGAKVLKNSTGYNLTQLLIGSEGTLAIITKIIVKLLPAPKYNILLSVPFSSAQEAIAAVGTIFQVGIIPSAIEFIEKDAIDFGQEYLGIFTYDTEHIGALLLIELDGNYLEEIWKEAEKLFQTLEKFTLQEIRVAESQNQKEELWKLRRCLGEAVRRNGIYKEVDTVVPRARLPELLAKVKGICRTYGLQSVCYGHAGDGNLHVNIIKSGISDEYWKREVPKAVREIFLEVKRLEGMLSGEHGVGCVLPPFLDIVFSQAEIALMQGIKKVFDPKGILNPGKIF